MRAILAAALILAAQPALAQSVALMIGNESYEEIARVRSGDDMGRAGRELDDHGVRVVSGRNTDLAEMEAALTAFGDMAEDADAMAVGLSGHFVTSGVETYFLPTDAEGADLAQIAGRSIPLSTVMGWLSEVPGRAILVLGAEDARGDYGRFLRNGIGDLDPPDGVVVLTGTPRNAARFVTRILAEPGETVSSGARSYDMEVTGDLDRDFAFLKRSRGTSRSSEAQSDFLRDRLAWSRAADENTARAYQSYLAAWPNGMFADMARNRIRAFDESPTARAERAEQSLDLNRAARRAVQRDLSLLNYDPRGIDGIFGPGTRGAIKAWQRTQGLSETGFLDSEQIARLRRQAEARSAELEAEAERRRAQLRAQDEAYWDETGALGRETGLRDYLDRYPDGIYAERAREELNEIERRAENNANARERRAWLRVQAADRIADYQDFLSQYPDGRYASAARDRIDELGRAAGQSAAAEEEERLDLNAVTRQIIEQRLAALGLNPGAVDGRFDRNARQALRRYQETRGLPATGYVSEDVVVRLLADSVRQIFD